MFLHSRLNTNPASPRISNLVCQGNVNDVLSCTYTILVNDCDPGQIAAISCCEFMKYPQHLVQYNPLLRFCILSVMVSGYEYYVYYAIVNKRMIKKV